MKQKSTAGRKASRKWADVARRVFVMSVLVGVLTLALGVPDASAAGEDWLTSTVAPFAWLLIVVGGVGLLLTYVMRDTIKAKNLPLFAGLTLVMLILGTVGVVGTSTTTTPPPPEPFKFELVPSVDTTGGDTIPAGNYDSCDTEAGGTTAEWTTTEGTYDAGAKTFTANIAIDTDLATSAALWTEPNCLQMTFSVRLLNGRDADGDGATDAVNYYFRISSVSRTTLSTDGSNGTLNTAGFVRDGVSETSDWYLLYRTDASTWISACPEARSTSSVPTSCGWGNVGNHNGGAADTVYTYLMLEDRGLFANQEPAVGSSVVVTYEFGGPGVESQTFTLLIRLNSRATTNLS